MPVSHDPFESVRDGNAKQVEVRRDDDEALELRQAWMPVKSSLVFGVMMAIFALVLLLMFGPPDSAETLAVMAGIFVLVGYVTAAQCFNFTIMVVTETGLRWRNGPLPWRRGGRLRAEEIAAVVYGKVRKTYSAEESERFRRYGDRKRTFYAVGVLLRSGKGNRRLFEGMLNEADGAMTAELIAGRLGGIEVQQAEQEDLAQRTDLKIALGIAVVVVLVVIVALVQ
jgi:hypothetical protein